MDENKRSFTRQSQKRKELEGFADANFNVRQWLNQTFATQPNGQAGLIASSETFASQLLSDLQVHTSDLSQQLEHGIGQALARLPRTAAEISRMAVDASNISRQVAEIRTVVDPVVMSGSSEAQAQPNENAAQEGSLKESGPKVRNPTQADISRLQKNKEKLLWCRNVLRSAQTLSSDIQAVEKGLRALGGSSFTGTETSGGIADIEQLASSIRRINVSLGTIKAVDPSFGSTHEDKIKGFERQLQTCVERECLETVKSRKSTVPLATNMSHADARRIASALENNRGPSQQLMYRRGNAERNDGKVNSPASLVESSQSTYTIKPVWATSNTEKAQQARANRLFAILRTIQRDGVAVEALIQSSVDDLTRFFGSAIVPAAFHSAEDVKSANKINKSSCVSAIDSLPGLLRLFFKHVGAQVGQDIAYLWALADLTENHNANTPAKASSTAMDSNIIKGASGESMTLTTIGGKSALLSGANFISTGTTNEGIDDTIADAAATIVRRTFEAIAVPLKNLITDLVSGGEGGDAEENINASLVLCLQSSREAEVAGKRLLEELLSRDESLEGDKLGTSQSNTILISRLTKSLPKAIQSTAARQLFAPLVESFILREKRILETLSKRKPFPNSGVTYPQMDSASDLVSALQPCLHRCTAFFAAETVNPCLNAWSRLTATLLNGLNDAVSKDVSSHCLSSSSSPLHSPSVAAAAASTGDSSTGLIQRLVIAVAKCEALHAQLITTQSDCFAAFVAQTTSSSDVPATGGSSAVIDVDILQTCLRVVEREAAKTISACKAALLRVLASPMEKLLVGRYSALGCWRTDDKESTESKTQTSASAQSRNFSSGSASPSELVRECCDLLMDVPVSLEANGIGDDDRAVLFKAVVVEVISMILGEISVGLGAAPEAAVVSKVSSDAKTSAQSLLSDGGKHSVVASMPSLRRYPSRLLCLSSTAISQLSADLDYLSSIVSYCGIEESASGGVYTVDGSELNYELAVDYWSSADGARCVSEYMKRLTFALPTIESAKKGLLPLPSDLAEVIDSADGDISASGSAYSVFMRLQRHLASLSQRVSVNTLSIVM